MDCIDECCGDCRENAPSASVDTRIAWQSFFQTSFHHSISQRPNPTEFQNHCHSRYELIYVAQGSGTYVVEGVRYPLLPNTVFLFRPAEYHYVRPKKETPFERYVIGFSSAVLAETVAAIPMLNATHPERKSIYFSPGTVPDLVPDLFRSLDHKELFAEETNPGVSANAPLAETFLTGLVNQILILLSHAHPQCPTEPQNELIGKIIQYLNDHLSEQISLEETSRRFFVSKYYLCHAFHAHTGCSVFTYLTTKRIALARQLLHEGIPAADVAFRVGFRDYSAFYRAYRKLTGESPSKTPAPIL